MADLRIENSVRHETTRIVATESRRLTAAAAMTAVLAAGCSSGMSPVETASPALTRAADADAPNAPRPTIVLVHGAWADASSWDGVTENLLDAGYEVRAIANPLENLITDAEYVADFLDTLTGPIVLVGHSYGGAVITNAAAGNRHVKALVYVDAAAPDVGEANGSLSGADSVLNRKPPRRSSSTRCSYPGAPAGAADLYLRKNDLPARTSPTTSRRRSPLGCGRSQRSRLHRGVRDARRSTPPGRRSRRGTSSAAATRSSRPSRRRPWPVGLTRKSRCSPGAPTSP